MTKHMMEGHTKIQKGPAEGKGILNVGSCSPFPLVIGKGKCELLPGSSSWGVHTCKRSCPFPKVTIKLNNTCLAAHSQPPSFLV